MIVPTNDPIHSYLSLPVLTTSLPPNFLLYNMNSDQSEEESSSCSSAEEPPSDEEREEKEREERKKPRRPRKKKKFHLPDGGVWVSHGT